MTLFLYKRNVMGFWDWLIKRFEEKVGRGVARDRKQNKAAKNCFKF